MIGKETMLNMIRQAVVAENAEIISELRYWFEKVFDIYEKYFPQFSDTRIVLDSGVLVGELAPEIDAALGEILRSKERG